MKLEWKSCFRLVLSAFALFLLIRYWDTAAGFASLLFAASTPLLIGCAIAYIINILMTAYERHYFKNSSKPAVIKSRRPVCMLAAFVTLLLIAALLVNLVVPELIASVELLISQIPPAIENVYIWLESWKILPEDIIAPLNNIDWSEKLEQIVSLVGSGVGSVMSSAINIVGAVFSGIVTALFALIFAIYLLLGKERLASQFDRLMRRYMKEKLYGRSKYVLGVVNESFHKYIVGQCTEAVILGSLCALGMMLLKIPYASMIGAVIAFTALIPVAGAYIGAGVGVFLIVMVSPMKALIFLAFIVVLQQLEGNIIYPKVVGSSMGLPAIWVLAAVTVGGGVMGVAGMLIGVPIAASIYRLVRDDVNKTVPENT